jgi:hypothetical protein
VLREDRIEPVVLLDAEARRAGLEDKALAEGHGLEITAQQLADRMCCFLAQEIEPG